MEHLFLVRHGEYKKDKLIQSSIEKLEKLSHQIKILMNEKQIYLISSNRPRAIVTSNLLADKLNLNKDFEKVNWLYERYTASILNKLIKEKQEYTAIIAVGHFEFIEGYVNRYIIPELNKKEIPSFFWEVDEEYYRPLIRQAECCDYNIESKIVELLPK